MPDRQEIIWIDCNLQVGREMRDVHPFLVLSPRAFNDKTSLVIGLPMTTAEYNADNPFAVVAGNAAGRKAGKTRCGDKNYHRKNQVSSCGCFEWKAEVGSKSLSV